jgi:hypothetical protein
MHYRAAVACITQDLASLTANLRFPAEHWRRMRLDAERDESLRRRLWLAYRVSVPA